MRKTIMKKSPEASVFLNRITDWMLFVLPIYRAAVPMIMLNVLVFHAQAICIPFIDLTLSTSVVYFLIFATHTFAAWSSLGMEDSHGCLYEVSRSLLASEIILYLYSLKSYPTLSLTMLVLLASGLGILLTFGRRYLMYCYDLNRIPYSLFRDVFYSLRKKLTPRTLVHSALHRYLVIGTAILFALPSAAAFSELCTEETPSFNNIPVAVSAVAEKPLLQYNHTIQLLEDDQWCLLSAQEKTHVLQVVADIETSYMQISPVVVRNCPLANNIVGSYDSMKREAQIDLDKHEGYSSLEYINTILHECRHAYQHDCVASLNWSDPSIQTGIYYAQARQWRYEHRNYISSSENPRAYFSQAIEKDARNYAEDGMYLYKQFLYEDRSATP